MGMFRNRITWLSMYSKAVVKIANVLAQAAQKYGFEMQRTDLTREIQLSIGADQRTIRKYIQLARDVGIITELEKGKISANLEKIKEIFDSSPKLKSA